MIRIKHFVKLKQYYEIGEQQGEELEGKWNVDVEHVKDRKW